LVFYSSTTFRFIDCIHFLQIATFAKHLPIMTVKTFLIQTHPGSYSWDII